MSTKQKVTFTFGILERHNPICNHCMNSCNRPCTFKFSLNLDSVSDNVRCMTVK